MRIRDLGLALVLSELWAGHGFPAQAAQIPTQSTEWCGVSPAEARRGLAG